MGKRYGLNEVIFMKLWIDDIRPAPNDYFWACTVNQAIRIIRRIENYDKEHSHENSLELIDIDHDAGDYAFDGGDYIKLLDWLEETGRNYPIHIHSVNPVGIANMRAIIQRNGWKEV